MKTFEQLLKEPIPEMPTESIFDIGGISHNEQIISKFYCFFLNYKASHGLNKIFMDALIYFVHSKINSFPTDWTNYDVKSEVSTKRRNRIDILIEEGTGKDKKAIIIENKIEASVYNDLDDYWNSVKAPEGRKLGILLLYKHESNEFPNFIKITHEEWMKEVYNRIINKSEHNFYDLLALQLTRVFYLTDKEQRKVENAHKYLIKNNKTILQADLNNHPGKSDNLHKAKAEKIISMRKTMLDLLFKGLKENLNILNLDLIKYVQRVDLFQIYFHINKYMFRLFICKLPSFSGHSKLEFLRNSCIHFFWCFIV
jgi:hypothetical protein